MPSSGKVNLSVFEDLRAEYLDWVEKVNALKQQNNELASSHAAVLHENESLRMEKLNLIKEQLRKIADTRQNYKLFLQKLKDKLHSFVTEFIEEMSNHDPLSLLEQEFERSLSTVDISNLAELPTKRDSRRNCSLLDDHDRHERVKEKISNMFLERINLTAMAEEQSSISNLFTSSTNITKNDGTFSISRDKDDSHTENQHKSPSKSPVSTIAQTPSFRRFAPKTPQLDSTVAMSDLSNLSKEEDSSWEYHSDVHRDDISSPSSKDLSHAPNKGMTTPESAQSMSNSLDSHQMNTKSDLSYTGNSASCDNFSSNIYPERTPEPSADRTRTMSDYSRDDSDNCTRTMSDTSDVSNCTRTLSGIQDSRKVDKELVDDLRHEYLDLLGRVDTLKEQNLELASSHAALAHENDLLRADKLKLIKDHLIKISAVRQDYDNFIQKLRYKLDLFIAGFMGEVSVHDPLYLLVQEFEKSLSSTGLLSSQEANDLKNSMTPSNQRIINSTFTETPSFRRINPKTPQLDLTHNDPSDLHNRTDEGWEFNSAVYNVPSVPSASISLDSIQNFVPKTPLLTQPVARTSTQNHSDINNTDFSLRSFINRVSVAYPEKTPEPSPIPSLHDPRPQQIVASSSRRLVSTPLTTQNNPEPETGDGDDVGLRRSTRPRKKVCYELQFKPEETKPKPKPKSETETKTKPKGKTKSKRGRKK